MKYMRRPRAGAQVRLSSSKNFPARAAAGARKWIRLATLPGGVVVNESHRASTNVYEAYETADR